VTWTEDDRRWLARIYAEDDAFRAQCREDERRRQEAAEAARVRAETEDSAQDGGETGAEPGYVRKSSADGLEHSGGDEPASADSATAPDEEGDGGGIFDGPDLNDGLARALGEIIVELRKEWRTEIKAERENHERAVTERDARIARLEGQIDTLLSFIGQRSAARNESGTVIDLPRGFMRRRNDAT
jgi:hypothetical protein